MNLVIDIGNTRIKAGVFDGKKLITCFIIKSFKKSSLTFLINRYAIRSVIFSSVVKEEKPLAASESLQVFYLNHKTALPIVNDYATPATLGTDRLANACGAAILFKKKNCLVFDAGTCLKFDFITDEAHYKGGAISPGLNMRYQALHDYTDMLPLVRKTDLVELTGNSTKTSIASGVQHGIVAEAEHLIGVYKKQFKGLKVIVTGGDMAFFADRLKTHIFAAPDLTLVGLNSILNFNLARQ